MLSDSVVVKVCTSCLESLSLDHFARRIASPDGLAPICKACKKLKDQRYYEKNREKVLARVLARQRTPPSERCSRSPGRPYQKKERVARYGEEVRSAVVAMRQAGRSLDDIVTETGLSLNGVRYILGQADVQLSPEQRATNNGRRHDVSLDKDVIRLRREGRPLNEICAATNLNRNTVKKVLSENPVHLDAGVVKANVREGWSRARNEKLMRLYGVANEAELMAVEASKRGGVFIGPYLSSQEYAQWRCSSGHVFVMRPNGVRQGQWCPRCSRVGPSEAQLEILDFVRSIYPGEVLCSDRTTIPPLELDVYVPALKFGVEYNGLIYHSSKFHNSRGRHAAKAKACREAGVRLLAVFQDEWADPLKNRLIREMLRMRLGSFQGVRLDARDLDVERFVGDREEVDEFFSQAHLDGTGPWSSALVMRHAGSIVMAASFRENFAHEFELARMATRPGYVVRGGAGRLLSRVRDRDLVSYSSSRLSDGAVYRALGFSLLRENPPSYWYTDGVRRVWRWRCRKRNDSDIVTKFPTEEDQARGGVFSRELFGHDRPLYRVEDYGHLKWIRRASPTP